MYTAMLESLDICTFIEIHTVRLTCSHGKSRDNTKHTFVHVFTFPWRYVCIDIKCITFGSSLVGLPQNASLKQSSSVKKIPTESLLLLPFSLLSVISFLAVA